MKDQDLAKDQDSGKETSRSRSLNDSNWLNEKKKKEKEEYNAWYCSFRLLKSL